MFTKWWCFAQKQKVTDVGAGGTNQSFKSSNATTMVGGPQTYWTPLSFVEYIEFYALLGETKGTHPRGAKLIHLRGIPGNHRGCDLQCDCGPRTSGNEWEVTICKVVVVGVNERTQRCPWSPYMQLDLVRIAAHHPCTPKDSCRDHCAVCTMSLCCLKILQCKTENFSGLEFMHPLNYALMCTVQCPPLFIFVAELTLKSLNCAWEQYTRYRGGWDPIDSHICSLQYNGTHYPMQTSQHHHRCSNQKASSLSHTDAD